MSGGLERVLDESIQYCHGALPSWKSIRVSAVREAIDVEYSSEAGRKHRRRTSIPSRAQPKDLPSRSEITQRLGKIAALCYSH